MMVKAGLVWISTCLSLCSGFAIGNKQDTFLRRAFNEVDNDLSASADDIYDNLVRRQTSGNTLSQSSAFKSLSWVDLGSNFTVSLQNCIDRSVVLGPYIDHNGTNKAAATVGDIYDDVEAAYKAAIVRSPGQRPSLVTRPLYALVQQNAQALYDKAVDILNNEILCPDQGEEIHTELRKLLQNGDNEPANNGGDEWSVAVITSVIAGGAGSFIHWKNRSNATTGTDIFLTGTVAFTAQFAISMVYYAGTRGWISENSAVVFNAVTAWFSAKLDKCKEIIQKAKAAAATCLTIGEAHQQAQAGPNANVPELGEIVVDPGNIEPLPAANQPIPIPNQAACPASD